MQVDSTRFTLGMARSTMGSSRIASIRGVPTVHFGGGTGLFIWQWIVQIFGMSPAAELRAAHALRTLADTSPTADLPRPPPALLAGIDKACGAQTGQSSPVRAENSSALMLRACIGG
jgi:hypothetical protein